MSRVLRAAFVDLDDTFLAPDKSIPQPNLALMDELERWGIELVPCTGRHVGGVPRAMLDHPCVHHVVASNGGIVHDLDAHADLRVVGMDHQQILSLYDELLECALLSTDLDLRMQSIRTRLDDTGLYASPHFV